MNQESPSRRGHTLVEMIVVMTVGAMLLGIAVSVLHVLMRVEQSGRAHVERHETLARLADQFREDVHAASVKPAADGESVWRLDLAADRTVRYAAEKGRITREERMGDKTASRESYIMPDDYTAAMAPDDAKNPSLVGLIVKFKGVLGVKDREIRIDAALGKDRRFAEIKKEGQS
jgi:prepilin-type N-terminal cleavage/methylation domain-containing protein